jgi:hypothetical protein
VDMGPPSLLTEADLDRTVSALAREFAGMFGRETIARFEQEALGLRNRGEPSGFASLLSAVMTKAMRRENTKDLERLKELLEGR